MKKIIFFLIIFIGISGCSDSSTESSNGNSAEITSPDENEVFFVDERVEITVSGNNIEDVSYQDNASTGGQTDTSSHFSFTRRFDENDIGNVTMYLHVNFIDGSDEHLSRTIKIIYESPKR